MLKQLSLPLYRINRGNIWPILSALMVTGVIDQGVSRRWSEKIEAVSFEELNKGRVVFLGVRTRSNNPHAKKILAESLVASRNF